ncbi:MAG: glycosyltransferase [Candidatus Omnitrophica bacterium]|nr:glycosyltransferase [Candidatus Omnitrophota bacterium]
MNNLPVSIVILTYNGKELLKENLPTVIDAVRTRNFIDEIIVVDNGSTDGTEPFLREHSNTLKILRLPANQSVGVAYNIAVKACSHRIVILLNNDVRVNPGFIEPLIQHFLRRNIFSVSSLNSNSIRNTTNLSPPHFILYSGGHAAYDRQKFLELGGFHPIYGRYYYEDRDLGYRAWKRGWRSLCEPASLVYHQGEGTIKREPKRSVRQLRFRNRMIFFLSCYDSLWTALSPIVCSILHTFFCLRPYLLKELIWIYQHRGIIVKKRRADQPFWKLSDKQVKKIIHSPFWLEE